VDATTGAAKYSPARQRWGTPPKNKNAPTGVGAQFYMETILPQFYLFVKSKFKKFRKWFNLKGVAAAERDTVYRSTCPKIFLLRYKCCISNGLQEFATQAAIGFFFSASFSFFLAVGSPPSTSSL